MSSRRGRGKQKKDHTLLWAVGGLVSTLAVLALTFIFFGDPRKLGSSLAAVPRDSPKAKEQAIHSRVTTRGNEAEQSEAICLIEAQYTSAYPRSLFVDSRSTKPRGSEWLVFVKTEPTSSAGDRTLYACVTRLTQQQLSIKSFNAVKDTENRHRTRMLGFE